MGGVDRIGSTVLRFWRLALYLAWTVPLMPVQVLGLGTVEVIVEFHRPTTFAECGSRKMLARYCQERVAAGLEAALTGRRQTPPGSSPPETRRHPAATDIPAPALG